MKNAKEICTCDDYTCPFNPVNHDEGCAPCIYKNLRLKEIPSCFFNDVDCEKPTKDYHYEDFAALIDKAKEQGKL